jgi:pimeloyl-ACP methyl ester carboxylesterase
MSESLKFIFGPERFPTDFAIRGGGILSLKPQTFISASTDLQNAEWSMPQIEESYGSMKTPVHVLFAKEDRILDCKLNGEDLRTRIPGTKVTVVSGGHMLPVTQIEVCKQFIQDVAG